MAGWRKIYRFLNGPEPFPGKFGIAQSVFTRGLGLIYLIAFVSWWVQLDGLVGSKGIVPVASWLPRVEASFWQLPTILHWSASDPMMHWICLISAVLSLAVIAGALQGPSLAILWILYLSLVKTGAPFMSFQWDILLLETGFIAMFFAPWRLWVGPRTFFTHGASGVMVLILHVLLFKLMLLSGFVKIASLDSAWWFPELSALTFHYETQPIPHVGAWFAHQLPLGFHQFSVVATYVIEIGLSFLIFMGRRARVAAFYGFVSLMLLIIVTGNYTYFNLLTMLLCFPLLSDEFWPKVIREKWVQKTDEELTQQSPIRWTVFGLRTALLAIPLVTFSLAITSVELINGFDRMDAGEYRQPKIKWRPPLSQFHISSSYGLFRVMTKDRPEIIIEGSVDGANWRPYEHRWKPDRLDEMPKWVAPHQPRMDWQLWFAALSLKRGEVPVWLENLLIRVRQGEPDVIRLFAENPFPKIPPRYVRARLFLYEFTSSEERAETGDWWKRAETNIVFSPRS